MVRLKPRLGKIAGLVKPGSVVADIGTDHGYLPLYLIYKRISPKVIATEQLSPGLREVSKLKEEHDLGDELQLRTGDGFAALKDEDAVEVAVIAGMGGRTIAGIITEGVERAAACDYLLLQPMCDAFLLRNCLKKIGFCIISEHLALENNLFFEIMRVERVEKGEGGDNSETPFPRELGSALLSSSDPLLIPYLENKLKRCRKVLNSLSKARQEKALQKKKYYKELLNYLEELLLTLNAHKG